MLSDTKFHFDWGVDCHVYQLRRTTPLSTERLRSSIMTSAVKNVMMIQPRKDGVADQKFRGLIRYKIDEST